MHPKNKVLLQGDPAERSVPRRSGSSGFTLIELLVVIAIIAVLAAMLLPVLAKAKAKGQSIRCVNNLKQMGVANRMYVDDYNDHLAYPNYDGGDLSVAPAGWLYWSNPNLPPMPQGQIPNPYDSGSAWYNQVNLAYGTGLWFKYINNPNLYLCPVDITSKSWAMPAGRNNKLSTYVMDGSVVGFKNTSTSPPGVPCKLTSVWSPECYLMWEPDEFTDPQGGKDEYNDGSNDPHNAGQGIGLLHSKHGGNALALDGHVDFVTSLQFSQYAPAVITPPKTLLYWDVPDAAGHP